MKLYKYCLIISSVILLFTSCDKETEGVSRITYYVDMELKGDDIMTIPIGTTFSDPGVIATEGDNDITESVTVKGNVDINKTGLYTLTYSVTNVDGFSSSIERAVMVYDPSINTDISGEYSVAEGSYRYWIADGARVSFSGYNISISKLVPGIFYVSDFFGGYYDQRAGYGPSYAMTGYFKLNADNTIEILSSYVAGWGDSISKMENAKYDPESNSIYWEVSYGGSMIFYITFTK